MKINSGVCIAAVAYIAAKKRGLLEKNDHNPSIRNSGATALLSVEADYPDDTGTKDCESR